MKKVIIETFLGIIFFLSGIAIPFVNFSGIGQDSNPWTLGISGLLLVIGVFILFHAGRVNTNNANGITKEPINEKKDSLSLLDRNNKLISEWKKTTTTEDRLKMLSLQANAEENSSKF